MSITRSFGAGKPSSPALESLADELAQLVRTRLDLIAEPAESVPLHERPVLGVTEAAELIGVSDKFLRDRIARGDLPHVPMGTRKLIRRESLDAWLRSLETIGGAA